ncbi:hypothetical protein [Haloarcula sp. H-GB5]|jgi:hypothetical protein
MARRGGYRTDAQKHGGGKTRQQQVRNKINRHRRRLRENGLEDLVFSTKPASVARGDDTDYAIFGVYKDGSEWVLTGLAATDKIEKVNRHRGGGYSRTEVRGRYVATGGSNGIKPNKGIEIKRFDTKKAALKYVSAEGSERVEAGSYLVRSKHNPRTRREEVDKNEFQKFRQKATIVRE